MHSGQTDSDRFEVVTYHPVRPSRRPSTAILVDIDFILEEPGEICPVEKAYHPSCFNYLPSKSTGRERKMRQCAK